MESVECLLTWLTGPAGTTETHKRISLHVYSCGSPEEECVSTMNSHYVLETVLVATLRRVRALPSGALSQSREGFHANPAYQREAAAASAYSLSPEEAYS